jgi:hypothetical protein
MRRSIGLVGAALLVGVSVGSAASTESASPPWFGGRIEMPEHGFALVLPDGWVGIDSSTDLSEQVAAWARVRPDDLAPEDVTAMSRTVATAATAGMGLVAFGPMREPWCGVAPTLAAHRTLDEVIDSYAASMLENEFAAVVQEPTPVDVRAGPGRVLVVTVAPPDQPSTNLVTYVIEGSGVFAGIFCSAGERPDDDWLSLAESLEFLDRTYVATPDGAGAVSASDVAAARERLKARLESLGLGSATVTARDDGTMTMEVPGAFETKEVERVLAAPGMLQFIPVPQALYGQVVQGEPLPKDMTDIEPLITSSELESAVVGEEPNTSEPVVTIQLTDIGARLFDDHAADHLGEQIAVVLDGVVLTAPVLYASEFGGQMLIVGDFTESEVQSLAAILRSGSLPYPINVQVEQ